MKKKIGLVRKVIGTIFIIIVLALAAVLVAILVNTLTVDKEEDIKAYIGDTVTVNNVNFTVSKAENTNQVGSQLLGDTTTDNFILVYITIANNKDSEIMLMSSYFCLYRAESKYETHSSAMYIDGGLWVLEKIGPGISKSLVLLYETPDKHTESEYILEVRTSSSSSSKRIILTGDKNTEDKFYIGDTVTVNNVNFTVSKAENANQVGSHIVGDTTTDNFILVYITIANNTDSEIMLMSSYFCLYRGGSRYETHTSAIYIDNGLWISEKIGPGISKSFVLLYETPDKHTESQYVLEVRSSSSSGSIRIILTTDPDKS